MESVHNWDFAGLASVGHLFFCVLVERRSRVGFFDVVRAPALFSCVCFFSVIWLPCCFCFLGLRNKDICKLLFYLIETKFLFRLEKTKEEILLVNVFCTRATS